MKQMSGNRMTMKTDYTLLPAFLVLVSALHGQGTVTREKPADYPVRAELPKMQLAAEYLVHSMPTPKGVIFVQDYLVMEVAAYPKGKPSLLTWTSGEFTLKINGRGHAMYSQSPGMVAASLKYPDWQQRPTATVEAGVGDGSVSIGRPPAVGRFPGDPTGSQRIPRPRAPEPESPTGETAPPEMPIGETCQRLALPDGAIAGPVSGYLFFPYSGKIKAIRSLELLYEGSDGTKATLSLL